MTANEFSKKYKVPYNIVYNITYKLKPICTLDPYLQYDEDEMYTEVLHELSRRSLDLSEKIGKYTKIRRCMKAIRLSKNSE